MAKFYGHPDFYKYLKDIAQLHSEKNKDYAQGGDPLGNFRRVSLIEQLYPCLDWTSDVGVAISYMLKQLDAALWLLNQKKEGEVESVDTRLRDVAVYSLIIRILHKENVEYQWKKA